MEWGECLGKSSLFSWICSQSTPSSLNRSTCPSRLTGRRMEPPCPSCPTRPGSGTSRKEMRCTNTNTVMLGLRRSEVVWFVVECDLHPVWPFLWYFAKETGNSCYTGIHSTMLCSLIPAFPVQPVLVSCRCNHGSRRPDRFGYVCDIR